MASRLMPVRVWTKGMNMNFITKDMLKMVAYVIAAYAIPLTLYWTVVG
jgi:hypothetical protein